MKEKLLEAKVNKNDEFYTQLPDINNELKNKFAEQISEIGRAHV